MNSLVHSSASMFGHMTTPSSSVKKVWVSLTLLITTLILPGVPASRPVSIIFQGVETVGTKMDCYTNTILPGSKTECSFPLDLGLLCSYSSFTRTVCFSVYQLKWSFQENSGQKRDISCHKDTACWQSARLGCTNSLSLVDIKLSNTLRMALGASCTLTNIWLLEYCNFFSTYYFCN